MRKLQIGLSVALAAMAATTAQRASAQTVTATVDVDASAGASSNPYLLPRPDPASGYVQIGVAPNVAIVDGLTTVVLNGFYRRTDYFRLYDGSDSYGGTLTANGQLNEQLTLRTSGQYSSLIAGETGNFLTGPTDASGGAGSGAPGGSGTPPTNPTDVSLIGTRSRINSWSLGSGLDWKSSALDFVSVDAVASGTSYGSRALAGYRGGALTVNYARTLSARISIGVALQGQWLNYDGAGNDGSVYQPQLTLTAQLSERWKLNAALGLLVVNSRVDSVSDRSVGVSGDASLCRESERGRFCLRGFRDAQNTGVGAISERLGFSLEYFYRLSDKDTVQASATYTKLNQSLLASLNGVNSYGDAQLSFQHQISRRLSVGTDVAYRRSFEGPSGSRDDINVFLSIHSKFGKFR